MSDDNPSRHTRSGSPTTIADVLQDLEPMGDLGQFAIDDLTPNEEDAFFGILEDA